MRILLIEDQPPKRDQIKSFIQNIMAPEATVHDASSLRAALKLIVDGNKYDLVLLDMSMPNFDTTREGQADNATESFAGRELLEHMRLRGIQMPVIVITQYAAFEGGTVTLESLTTEFEREYGDFFLGSIYFNSASDEWQKRIVDLWEAADG